MHPAHLPKGRFSYVTSARGPRQAVLCVALLTAGCNAGFTNINGLDGAGDGLIEVGVGSEASTAPAIGVNYGSADPGTKQIHRLNVVEYDNTVQDLVGTQQTVAADTFPSDDAIANFDNIAAILVTSPIFVEAAANAASTLAAEVVASAGNNSARDAIYLRVAPCAANNKISAEACLKETAIKFGLRAWRRPLSDAEVSSMLAQVRSAGSVGLPAQIGTLVESFLTSPYFLYRVELDPLGSKKSHALTGYELASRLSYFLWRTCPDDTLLAAAKDGSLLTDAGLTKQFQRMFANDRANSLVDGFAFNWLGLKGFTSVQLDEASYPDFTADIRSSMLVETKMFLRDFMLRGVPLDQMLTADYSYLDDRLAAYYGFPLPGSDVAKRVSIKGQVHRAGVLSQGTSLAVGSSGVSPSPVRRGYVLLKQILCAAPPPPPPDIPSLTADGNVKRTGRQALEGHVSQSSCAGCHVEMDNLGFAFEGLDSGGRTRTTDNGQPVDTSGEYSGGKPFADNAAMMPMVAKDPRFASCVTSQVLSYALGRMTGDAEGDEAAVAGLASQLSTSKMSVPVLLQQIVLSQAFRSRRG